MPTSGSVNFTVSRDNLIQDALLECGAIGIGETPTTTQIEHAARRLNSLVKSWSSFGPSLWARKTGYVFPQSDTNEIKLGPTGDHASLSYRQTKLASSASSGAGVIVVESSSGISNGDFIGISQNDGKMHWTTVNGNPSGNTINLVNVLTSDANAGNYVWSYSTKLQRPLRVLTAFVRTKDNTDLRMLGISKSEYDYLANKTIEGIPNIYGYDPQLVNGILYIHPRFDRDHSKLIVISFQRPFEDFDAAIDEPDFPHEWYDALCLNLAEKLAPVYGLPPEDRIELRQRARIALDRALENEPELGSIFIRPDLSCYDDETGN